MSDEERKKPAAAGSPAWVMTFADLMSLLMCFFVLLLSFSEMDVSKYKQIAGSMKEAFGVQRKHSVKEPPKGINIIAQEFSAGRPAPTPLNVMEQITSDEMKMFLDTGGKKRRPGDQGNKGQAQQTAEQAEKAAALAAQQAAQLAAQQAGKDGQDQQKKDAADAADAADQAKDAGAPADADAQDKQLVLVPKEDALRALKAKQAEEAKQRLEENARRIRSALRWEIKDGAVDVETEELKIIIRIREKASFGSGRADLRDSFRPILKRVGEILKETDGQIIVSGHTDNIPIYTDRFRSNWELSAARAVSVVHDLVDIAGVESDRFMVEGLASTRPIVPNTNWENRARNRRVEIKLVQGEDLETKGELTGKPKPLPAPAGKPSTTAPAKQTKPANVPKSAPGAQPKSEPKGADPFIISAG